MLLLGEFRQPIKTVKIENSELIVFINLAFGVAFHCELRVANYSLHNPLNNVIDRINNS